MHLGRKSVRLSREHDKPRRGDDALKRNGDGPLGPPPPGSVRDQKRLVATFAAAVIATAARIGVA